MDENFKKFKKKVWFDILIKCIAAGAAAGLFAVVCTLLPCRLYGVNLLWVYYALIALAGVALGGGAAFLFLRTNDKKIAMRLDKELNLQERVQTAYEFGGAQGDILDLQRVNASSALGSVPLKALPFKNIVATILCGAIALLSIPAIPLIATLVPPVFASTEEIPEDEKPRPITDWEWKALDELIEYVRASKKADAAARAGMLTPLNGLRTVLLDGVSQASLTGFVQGAVSDIRNGVSDANGRAGITDEQKALNSEEESYVVNRLYEIFSLQPKQDDPENPDNPKDPEDPEDPDNPDDPWGEQDVNSTPFFDPEKGAIKLGDAIDDYYKEVQKALEDGTISREEWENIMVTYFANLNNKKD